MKLNRADIYHLAQRPLRDRLYYSCSKEHIDYAIRGGFARDRLFNGLRRGIPYDNTMEIHISKFKRQYETS